MNYVAPHGLPHSNLDLSIHKLIKCVFVLFFPDTSSTTSSIIDDDELEEFERTGQLRTPIPTHISEAELSSQPSPSSAPSSISGTPSANIEKGETSKSPNDSAESRTPQKSNNNDSTSEEVLDSLLMPPPESWSGEENSDSIGLRPSALSLGLSETIKECMTPSTTASSDKSKYGFVVLVA